MRFHTASIESTVENNTRLFPISIHVSASTGLILVGAFRNYYVAAFSTALRNATEENEAGGYVTFRFRPNWQSIVPQRIGWNSGDVTKLVTTEHIRNKNSLLKSRSFMKGNRYWDLVETVNWNILFTAQVS